jgi:hypothetical protein
MSSYEWPEHWVNFGIDMESDSKTDLTVVELVLTIDEEECVPQRDLT